MNQISNYEIYIYIIKCYFANCYFPPEFLLLCMFLDYPEYEGHFYVEADPAIHLWGNTLNEVRIFMICKN